MFTKEQLAWWRSQGFENLDSAYDLAAVDTQQKAMKIKFNSGEFENESLKLTFFLTSSGLKNHKAIVNVVYGANFISSPMGDSEVLSSSVINISSNNVYVNVTIPISKLSFFDFQNTRLKAIVFSEGIFSETKEFKIFDLKSIVIKELKDLKYSLAIVEFIKEMEYLHKAVRDENDEIIKIVPYSSVEGGAQTIGWGHKIKKGEDYSKGISIKEAEDLLKDDIDSEGVAKFNRFTGEKKINVPLTQNEYDALISATFNNGYGDSLAKMVNKGRKYWKENIAEVYKAFLTRRLQEIVSQMALLKGGPEKQIYFYMQNILVMVHLILNLRQSKNM